jgi:hypothetical protein
MLFSSRLSKRKSWLVAPGSRPGRASKKLTWTGPESGAWSPKPLSSCRLRVGRRPIENYNEAGHGSSRYAHSWRRHRSGGDGRRPSHPQSCGGPDRVGAARRRHDRVQAPRHVAPPEPDRCHSDHPRRPQGTRHDADRRRLHERERGVAQGARFVREPAARVQSRRRAVALHERQSGDRSGEHRGPLCRPRAPGGARGRREPEDHLRRHRNGSRSSPLRTHARTDGN